MSGKTFENVSDSVSSFVDVSDLKVGYYVCLDLGWMSHPFPLNSFKIQTQEQVQIIRGLGLERVRYVPEKSDLPQVLPVVPDSEPEVVLTEEEAGRIAMTELLIQQRNSLKLCERQFAEASKIYRQVAEAARGQPEQAKKNAEALIGTFLGSVLGERESCIRLLSEQVGERASLHAVNVTIISLLLGKALGLNQKDMFDLGVGALLHDLGKRDLPDRLRLRDEAFSPAEQQIYQEHVAYGVTAGRRMGLEPGALLVIGQHHEHCNGSGYPLGVRQDKMTKSGCIVSLVNHYDNLCNPNNPGLGMTPHEALSYLFAQNKSFFDSEILGYFIRMMGVYPPGSVVQLTDNRYALVVSVNSSRPLRPSVIIHQQGVPKEEALIVDLEKENDLGIRRSIRPLQLPKATMDYLSPRQRICYFFEYARDMTLSGTGGVINEG